MRRRNRNSIAAALLLCLFALFAPATYGQTAGQADIAIQSYLLGNSHQPLYNTSGTAIDFKEFVPSLGLVHAAVEGYGGSGYAAGTNFVGLEQVHVLGWRGDFIGGDFQLSASPLKNPFTNIYTPDITGRGGRIGLSSSDRSLLFFGGEETLLTGPRIPYRIGMPQLMAGGIARQKVGRWEFGVRLLHLSTDTQALAAEPNFALPYRVFNSSSNAAAQATFNFTSRWKFFSEAGYGTASQPSTPSGTQQPLSAMLGSTWENGKLTLRANYIRQSTTYLPLLGYFTGDRQGPFVEGQYRFNPKLTLYGSASGYSNNLENNANLPTFHSTGMNGGASFMLPWRLNGSASLSTLDLTTRDPLNPGTPASSNRQINLSLSRQVQRHNLRFSVIDMKLSDAVLGQRQRFFEVGDTFTWKRLTLGGAARLQGSQSTESRDTIFYRGSVQANLKFAAIYANIESGNDLANRSIFSRNSFNTNVVGVTTPPIRGWSLQFEGFRNTLNTTINPLSVFLYSASGSNSLEQTLLSSSGQWSAYFRLNKQVRWGQGLPAGSPIERYAMDRAPLVGAIRGLVLEQTLAGLRPAVNVAISLNQSRTAVTDSSGYYVFNEVPEGRHDVQLDPEKLPTEYEPGPGASANVIITPRATIRRDFSVIRLASLSGRIVAPAGIALDNIVIRLAGTQRYTTPEDDGAFFFHNLREGEYEIALDIPTLPETALLASAPTVKVVVPSTPAAEVKFELRPKPLEEKPVRKMLEERIHIDSEVKRSPGSKPKAALPSQSKRSHPKSKVAARTSAGASSASRPPNS